MEKNHSENNGKKHSENNGKKHSENNGLLPFIPAEWDFSIILRMVYILPLKRCSTS